MILIITIFEVNLSLPIATKQISIGFPHLKLVCKIEDCLAVELSAPTDPHHILDTDTFVECGLGTLNHTHLSYRRRQVFQRSFIMHKCVRVDLSDVLPVVESKL